MIVAIVCRRLHAPSGDARLQHFLKLVKTGKVSGVGTSWAFNDDTPVTGPDSIQAP